MRIYGIFNCALAMAFFGSPLFLLLDASIFDRIASARLRGWCVLGLLVVVSWLLSRLLHGREPSNEARYQRAQRRVALGNGALLFTLLVLWHGKTMLVFPAFYLALPAGVLLAFIGLVNVEQAMAGGNKAVPPARVTKPELALGALAAAAVLSYFYVLSTSDTLEAECRTSCSNAKYAYHAYVPAGEPFSGCSCYASRDWYLKSKALREQKKKPPL